MNWLKGQDQGPRAEDQGERQRKGQDDDGRPRPRPLPLVPWPCEAQFMRNIYARSQEAYAQEASWKIAHMPRGIDFGAYREAPRTIWRPKRDRFNPVYRLARPVIADLRAVERADKELEQHHADEALAHRILREALTRNAFGTASIEGNPLTLTDVESLLAVAPTPGRVAEPDEREILNYAAFMRDIDSLRVPRKPSDVRALHKMLFHGVLKKPGPFKDKPNFVGRRDTREVVYVPTLPEDVEVELAAALDRLHEADEHPLVRAAVFFHEFQSIHPFADGNGRLGRALTTLILWHEGYRGVQYALIDYAFNEDRDAYYAKLDEARQGEWDLTPWIAYMSSVFRATFDGAVQRFLFRGKLPTHLNERQVRVAEWFARLDRGNPGRRQKFNDVHEAFPQVPRRTLQLDLAKLSHAKILRRQGERKGTTYQFMP